jgi:hypothetical protein
MNARIVLLVVATAAASGGVGAYAGYLYAEKKLMKEYDEKFQDEIASTKKFYEKQAEEAEPEGDVVVEEIIVVEGYIPDNARPKRAVPKLPEDKRPRVVTIDEFAENPKDYDQRTITYYEGDDVLVDEHDIPIDDIDGVIGLASLDHFGYGSRDPDIVYVRNPWISMDLEVTREKGTYEESVAGSIKHSYGRPRKFRIDDD